MKKHINFARAAVMTMLLVLMLTAAQTAWAQEWTSYVSDVVVVGTWSKAPNDYTKKYTSQGYYLVEDDLNSGAGGMYVYLLYKDATRNNPAEGGYVSDFVLKVGPEYFEDDDPSDNRSSTPKITTITENGHTYTRVPYDGESTFIEAFGDLNCKTDSHDDYFIHLFYRKTERGSQSAVSRIWFTQYVENSVGNLDLNAGAKGDDIYMHVDIFDLTNRPKTDPKFIADFEYDGKDHNVLSSSVETIDPNDQILFRINGGEWNSNVHVQDVGTYEIEYKVSGNSNSYQYDSPIQTHTLTISKAQNTVTQAPTAKTLYAIGKELELVNAGSAKFGNLEYRIGSGDFSTSLPKATAAGTYNVYYRAEGSNNYDASEAQSMTVTINPRKTFEGFTQDGDGNYLIDTKEKYESFAEYVNVYGYDFADSKFLLTTDLTGITTMVGNYGLGLPFSGTFDGGGHSITVSIDVNQQDGVAPFTLISGATIKNLVVKGSVSSNFDHTSGLVGFAKGNSNLIQNCVVSTTINGGACISGILGHGTSSDVTIEGCLFDGLFESGGGSATGIFYGYGYYDGTMSIKNCLYKKHESQSDNNDLFFAVSVTGEVICTNCFEYTEFYKIYLNSGVTIASQPVKTYDVSKITTYADGGMVYDGKNVSEGLDITLSTDKKGYTVQCTYNGTTAQGTVQGKLNLRMPAADVTTTVVPLGYKFILPDCFEITNDVEFIDDDHIYVAKDVDEIKFARKFGYKETTETPSVYIVNGTSLYRDIYGYYTVTVDKDMEIEAEGFEPTDNNYEIATVADLIAFSKAVNKGNDCSGKTITVVANIDFNPAKGVSNNFTAIGTKDHPFKGTFDGGNDKGYTISGIRISASESYQGLFGNVEKNAKVKNVTIENAKISSTRESCDLYGGIAGYNGGTIANCTSSAEVSSTGHECWWYGGIAGRNYGNIANCTSSAKVLSSGPVCAYYGGISGSNGDGGTLSDNFVINAEINAIEHFGAIVGDNSGTLTDNYYYNCNVKGCNGEDIDGALPVYKLTLGEDITSPEKPTYTYGEDNYYKSELSLTFSYPEGYVLLANGKPIPDANSYEMPAEDVEITMANMEGYCKVDLPECFEITYGVEYIVGNYVEKNKTINFARKFGYTKPESVSVKDGETLSPDDYGYYTVTVDEDIEIIAEGYESQDDNYEIATVADLIAFSKTVNNGNNCNGKTITVVADIDFPNEDNNFTAIGLWDTSNDINYYFEGTFDGGGHKISGIRMSDENKSCQGLFGQIDQNGIVQDVILADANITGDYYVGGIVGYNDEGEISGCKVVNSVINANDRQGAIAGENYDGSLIDNYYYNCNVNEVTTNVGCNGADIDGALAVYKLTLGEGITTTTNPAFTYPEETNYYKAGDILEFSGGTEGYYANGEKINGNTYEMPENDVIISTPITVEVPYIDADGKEKTATAKPLYGFETELPEGWYVVNSDITFDHEITLTGNVNLILADGKTMTVTNRANRSAGINCNSESFSVFGQSGQSGKLEIKDCYRGIINCDIITLNGGVIQIKSQNEAVINGQIIINGGKVDMESVLQTAVRYSSCTIITGGNINIKTFNGSTSAGIDCSNIILGLARQEDQIAVTRYWHSGSPDDVCSNITIAEGQTLTDGKNLYSGTYTGEDVKVFDGKTLRRAFALTLPECMEFVKITNQDDGKVKYDFVVKFGYKLKSAVTRDGYKIEPTDGIYTITISADSEIKADFTSTDNYEIATVADLIAFSNAVNKGNGFSDKTVTVIADIDFKPAENEVNNFTAIGGRWDGAKGIYYDFNGTFDGGGHKIIGIRITGGDKNQGLFSRVGTTGIVQNVVICDANINSNEDYWAGGGIAGYSKGTISNCKVVNAVINANGWQGAIVGCNDNGTLSNNYYYNCNAKGCNREDIEPNDGAMPALIIDGDSEKKVTILPGDYSKAFYLRNFTAGIPTTIMLPFVFKASDFSNETFYYFAGINTETWTATMAAENQATTLSANTPYIFTPSETTAAKKSFEFSGVTVKTATTQAVSDEDKNWAFQGTYDYKSWNTEGKRTITNVYGFAATSGTNQEKGKIVAGEFVRAGLNTRIRPTRAYLEYTGNDKTLQKSALDLPERIKVVFIDKETSSVIDAPTINPSDPDGDIPTPTSEIQPVLDNVKVWSYDKTIFIQSRPGTDYRIIDATGRLLKEATTQSDRDEVRLGSRSGIVIVIIGGKSYKLNY